eukprot:TRINITY_DN4017_c0_g2_i1.p1 TRINITY_DN4017_c0_g2~~TRINITY_DN4017_c0_g2_i1.p1  ORF type:complete len:108 (-),score=23.16 TRINITY_DN4017_c0_g2_i1:22-345(-)
MRCCKRRRKLQRVYRSAQSVPSLKGIQRINTDPLFISTSLFINISLLISLSISLSRSLSRSFLFVFLSSHHLMAIYQQMLTDNHRVIASEERIATKWLINFNDNQSR